VTAASKPHDRHFGDDRLFYAVALVVAATALFLLVPGLDVAFSRLFYDPASGFVLSNDPALQALRAFTDGLIRAIVIVLIALLAVRLAAVEVPSLISPRITLFLISTLALGPGLIVNFILKRNWGRPRPRAVDVFGGDFPYVTVWNISGGFDNNHSFVSGEAASAIWLTAFALVVPADFRLPVVAVTVPYALAASLGRVAFGAHFLSDVLIAWGLTLCVIFVMHRLLIAAPPHALSEQVLEDRLSRIGRWLRGTADELRDRIAARRQG